MQGLWGRWESQQPWGTSLGTGAEIRAMEGPGTGEGKDEHRLTLDTLLHPQASGTVVTPAPIHTPPPTSSPAKRRTHLLQQGESHPGRVLTVSNDHSRKTVVPHVDVAQVPCGDTGGSRVSDLAPPSIKMSPCWAPAFGSMKPLCRPATIPEQGL